MLFMPTSKNRFPAEPKMTISATRIEVLRLGVLDGVMNTKSMFGAECKGSFYTNPVPLTHTDLEIAGQLRPT
jgi:hypothetical protein